MIIEKSPLELKNFIILKSSMIFNQPKEKISISSFFDQYEINIDYMIRPTTKSKFNIFIKIGVNNSDSPMAGYSIFTEGVGVFAFNEEGKLSEQECSHFLNFSAVGILINSIRMHFLNLTAFAPMGKYSLPAIDMNHLVRTKSELVQKAIKTKKKIIKT